MFLKLNVFVFRYEAKIIFTSHFLATRFSHLATEKKFQSPLGACIKQLIWDPDIVHVESLSWWLRYDFPVSS